MTAYWRLSGLYLFYFAALGALLPYLALYLDLLDFSAREIGLLLAVQITARIVAPNLVAWYSDRSGRRMLTVRLARFAARKLLLWSLALSALRWLLIAAFADKMAALAVAQLLHLASFGIFHAVSIGLVHRYFPGRLQGRGQALFSSLTFGAGTALGSAAAGFLWDGFGPSTIWLASAASAGLALVLLAANRGAKAPLPQHEAGRRG